MSAHFSVTMSDDLNRDIDKAVDETGNSKSEVMRKALQLYLAALDGTKCGLKVGLIDPTTEKMHSEFTGLSARRAPR